jgi:K(+)-stimulated pyrophosphate-energized sodium pump
VQNEWVPVAFLTGGFFSGLAGFLGMKTATYASARTANAARTSLNKGLQVAFRSGAVMGLVVVGLGLLDISFWYFLLNALIPDEALNPTHKLTIITTTMLTFGMGASTQALFARVGGGIYTKAADVGADLVGKVEAGIPEDDPRNPATIADNVGDNVGDVAGMGADLYESYCGSILATAALGAAAFVSSGNVEMQYKAVIAPMLIAAVGIVLSIIGIFAVRTNENATIRQLLKALAVGTNLSSVLIAVSTFGILYLLGLDNWFWISCSVIIGLLVGIVIGQATEYYTSQSFKPTQRVSESGLTGPATVIISGLGLGMLSTAIPVLAVVVGIICSFLFASGFDFNNTGMGLYGIGIAAVGMLSTLGITLATDAYGPIADNAGGNAEMSGLGKEVRKRTDALDSLGNTTAATGKGFAIGSAALTGLALLASYIEEIKIGLLRLGETVLSFANGSTVEVSKASFSDFMVYYDVTLMNPKVLSGMFIGSMMAFMFCGLTMNAVGRAAGHMVEEVRRQFREIPGILTGKAEPDYARCVEISTKGAQHEMVLPSLLAIIAPILTGLIFGVTGVIGLLIGGLSTGFVLAIFMANAGGAWDNAKKHVEEGNHGGKGSEAHKATVVGDTVGDPFKDTSGPSLNILIKLMSMVAIVMAGLTVAWSLF